MSAHTLRSGHVVLVDDEDDHLLERWVWRLNRGYLYSGGGGGPRSKSRWRLLHRMIMQAPQGMQVDHINRDKLDNRRVNLRLCTQAENLKNRRHCLPSKLGIRGVYFYEGRPKPYRGQVTSDHKKHSRSFKTLDECLAWVRETASALHGSFYSPEGHQVR